MDNNIALAGLRLETITATTNVPSDIENEIKEANALFNQAVQSSWNLEMDWLWLATKVTLDSQRHYCLKQALNINPESRIAKQALKMLQRKPGQPLKF